MGSLGRAWEKCYEQMESNWEEVNENEVTWMVHLTLPVGNLKAA
jgi:hypothetical protein